MYLLHLINANVLKGMLDGKLGKITVVFGLRSYSLGLLKLIWCNLKVKKV